MPLGKPSRQNAGAPLSSRAARAVRICASETLASRLHADALAPLVPEFSWCDGPWLGEENRHTRCKLAPPGGGLRVCRTYVLTTIVPVSFDYANDLAREGVRTVALGRYAEC
jgi:hypothetical protein